MAGAKICIIGGGPAGLGAALEGSRLGLRVDLFEKGQIGDNVRCAEGFIDSLHLLGKPGAGVCFKVNEVVLKIKREFRVNCRKINLWMINRKEWQRSLAAQALSAGVKIYENHRITAESLRQLQREYDWVIDTSGAPSVTSLVFGFRDYYQQSSMVTAQYVVEGDFSFLGERLKFVLLPNYFGYYWVFPKGRDVMGHEAANIGVGWFRNNRRNTRGNSGSLWEELERFLVQERIHGKVVRRFGGIVPIKLRQQLQYDNVLLAGDAAGCASPLHGGGIDLAFLTGRLAARWIAHVPERREDFSQQVWHLLQPKLKVEQRLCNLWAKLDFDVLDDFAGFITRNYRQVRMQVLFCHFWTLIRDLGTGIRFWSGLTQGNWKKLSFPALRER